MEKIRLILILVAVFSVGCAETEAPEAPPNLIEESKLERILVDLHITDAVISEKKYRKKEKGVQPSAYYNALFEKHGITKEQFQNSMAYYAKMPSRLDKIYDDVLNRLYEQEEAIVEMAKEHK